MEIDPTSSAEADFAGQETSTVETQRCCVSIQRLHPSPPQHHDHEDSYRIQNKTERGKLPAFQMCKANNKRHPYFIGERGGDDDTCEYPAQSIAEFVRKIFAVKYGMETTQNRGFLQAEDFIVKRELRELKNTDVGERSADGCEDRRDERIHDVRDLEEICGCQRRGESEAEEEAGKQHARVTRAIEMCFHPEECPCFVEHVREDDRREEDEEFGEFQYVSHLPIIQDFLSLCSAEMHHPSPQSS